MLGASAAACGEAGPGETTRTLALVGSGPTASRMAAAVATGGPDRGTAAFVGEDLVEVRGRLQTLRVGVLDLASRLAGRSRVGAGAEAPELLGAAQTLEEEAVIAMARLRPLRPSGDAQRAARAEGLDLFRGAARLGGRAARLAGVALAPGRSGHAPQAHAYRSLDRRALRLETAFADAVEAIGRRADGRPDAARAALLNRGA